MDNRSKLTEAYTPDKKARKDKIVVALSGGIDSFVMAYLLKIQKYDLIAVTVVNNWEDYAGDPEKILACHVNQTKIDQIKEFCNKFSITHYLIRTTSEFRENVIEPWLADKVLGRLPKPCWNCHEQRLKIIFEKMKELDAKYIATGHFAKLFHNDAHGTVFVHSSNDEHNDQSALLSRLPHDILTSLILPLSDLSKKEVLKLAENFGLNEGMANLKIHQCLKQNPQLMALFEKLIPSKLLKTGDITNLNNDENFGQHNGVHHHTFGEGFEIRKQGRPIAGIFGQYIYPEKRIVIVEESFLESDGFLLVNCCFSEDVSWVEPIRGFIAFSPNNVVECWIHPKSLLAFFVELMGKHRVLNGELITVFKKKGKNSKVYLTGEIKLLTQEPEPKEGVDNVPKINHAIDF